VELHRLAIYHDSGSNPWKLDKKWEALNPTEWSEVILLSVTAPLFLYLFGTYSWMICNRYFKMALMIALEIPSGQ
jgi:hypothetical protein